LSCFLYSCCAAPRELPSFPTRRSSDLDRAAAARAAGDARAVPGILRVAEERVLIGDAEGPLVQVRLAEDDRSGGAQPRGHRAVLDRKSTRLNSSHDQISYAVFCLKKKN